MSTRNFREILEAKWAEGKFVCVGLDTDYPKIPEFARKFIGIDGAISNFNDAIVKATEDLVCAYKLNTAFYEAYGHEGLRALRRTIVNIQDIAPDIPIILDAKRGDIGNTNAGYVYAAFDFLEADAITVHPYLGAEALRPFLDRADKGILVLCRTSNPGAGEFQDIRLLLTPEMVENVELSGSRVPFKYYVGNFVPLYQYVAYEVAMKWNKNSNCALVVGATFPEELGEVRQIVGDMPILIPGVGFQQKDIPLEEQVRQVVQAGKDSRAKGMIINSSRSIIFASNGPDFAEAARRETEKLHNLINQFRV